MFLMELIVKYKRKYLEICKTSLFINYSCVCVYLKNSLDFMALNSRHTSLLPLLSGWIILTQVGPLKFEKYKMIFTTKLLTTNFWLNL